jgi:hypothetical protein
MLGAKDDRRTLAAARLTGGPPDLGEAKKVRMG